MKVTRGIHNLRPDAGCVLTIGNFDGVHRGHQAMLARLRELAHEQRLACRVLTFEPHPQEFLAPARAPARLTRFREKMHLLHGYGVSDIVCARFDSAFASLSPERFVENVLVGRFRVRHLLVGDDFRFGHRGRGDFSALAAAGARWAFGLSRFGTVERGGRRVSSTAVRAALQAGDLAAAADLLGRPYTVCGRVSRGERLGRTLGFPTANLRLARNRSPLAGVFAVRVRDTAGAIRAGVANVGRRPTVQGAGERVEVHLLDFDGDLYGRELNVEFLVRQRTERRFAGLDALKAQIARDVACARRHLSMAGSR